MHVLLSSKDLPVAVCDKVVSQQMTILGVYDALPVRRKQKAKRNEKGGEGEGGREIRMKIKHRN